MVNGVLDIMQEAINRAAADRVYENLEIVATEVWGWVPEPFGFARGPYLLVERVIEEMT